MKKFNIGCFVCLFCAGILFCSYVQGQEKAKAFRLPDVPSTLRTPDDRAAYLSVHFWDHFDFTDTTLVSCPEITEQAFVDFISILPYSPRAQAAVDTLYCRASVERVMFCHFIELGEKYLYEPNSPMHNEELYILVLRALIENPYLSGLEKERPRFLLEMAMKNRPGDLAADFTFVCRDGCERRLSEITADYILIYFNDPSCSDCRRVKGQLSSSPVIGPLLAEGRLKLLSVCVEGKTAAWADSVCPDGWIDGYDPEKQLTYGRVYDLKAMPTLYLLDAGRRVILKDTTVRRIEARLE